MEEKKFEIPETVRVEIMALRDLAIEVFGVGNVDPDRLSYLKGQIASAVEGAHWRDTVRQCLKAIDAATSDQLVKDLVKKADAELGFAFPSLFPPGFFAMMGSK